MYPLVYQEIFPRQKNSAVCTLLGNGFFETTTRHPKFMYSSDCCQISSRQCLSISNPNCTFYITKKMDKKFEYAKRSLKILWKQRKENPYCDPRQKVWDEVAPVNNRGKHVNHRKSNPENVALVRSHINSIPRIESYYIRKDTSREYIDGGLTIAGMHRNFSSQQASFR